MNWRFHLETVLIVIAIMVMAKEQSMNQYALMKTMERYNLTTDSFTILE